MWGVIIDVPNMSVVSGSAPPGYAVLLDENGDPVLDEDGHPIYVVA